jgi:hypothetical protein
VGWDPEWSKHGRQRALCAAVMLVSAGLDSLLAAFVPEEVNPRAQAREVACSLHVMVTQTGELHFAVACVLCRANLEVLAALASPVDSLEVCCGCLV